MPSPSTRRSAPVRRRAEAWPKQASTSEAATPSPASSSATSRGLGQPARDVVVQVGEQAAVAGVQLRRGAEAEHGGVERVEPEPRARLGEPGVRVVGPRVGGERQRLVVGDVQPAQRVAGVRIPRPRARRGLSAGRRGTRSGRPRRRQPTSSRATPSAWTSSASPGFETTSGPDSGARRCWSVWATRGRSAPGRTTSRGCTPRARRRCPCRSRRRGPRPRGSAPPRSSRCARARRRPSGRASCRTRAARLPSSGLPPPRAAAMADSIAGWATPLGRIPSPSCMRETSCPKLWLPTFGGEAGRGVVLERGGRGRLDGGRADVLEFGDVGFQGTHEREHTGSRHRLASVRQAHALAHPDVGLQRVGGEARPVDRAPAVVAAEVADEPAHPVAVMTWR